MIKDETLLVGWFSNHHKPLAILRAKVKASLGKACELKKAGATRMGTNTWVGERLQQLKGPLQMTVVDPDYQRQNYKDLPPDYEYEVGEKVAREHRGGTAKKLVLDDEPKGFWSRVADHVSVTMPICKFLRRHDTSAPATGKVYHGWFEMGEHLKASNVDYAKESCDKHASRWLYSHLPFFAAAYVLDPEFIEHDHSSNEEVMDGFYATLEKVAILLQIRAIHEEDPSNFEQFWTARSAAIVADPLAQRSMDNFPSYPDASDADVKEFCAAANAQLAVYKKKAGIFARSWVMESAKDMPAYLWWDQNGGSTPELQVVARMVLAQPASASICERINSEFEFIKDRRSAPCPSNHTLLF